MGTPDFAVPVLDALFEDEAYEVVLVVTQPDRPKGRKRQLTASPVKESAMQHGIPVFQPEKLSEQYDALLSYDADLIVTAAYGQLLPQQVLDYPPYGCVNVHASLLPELRGGAPIHYAILQGKKKTGITIMYMAEKLDAGDIISQQSIEITDVDHVGTMHDKLAAVGADLLIETLPSIFAHTNDRIIQNDAEATFAPNITREQERIDWQQPGTVVYNKIRGLHPWPVAYTLFESNRMKVWWAELTNKQYKESQPGEVVEVGADAFIVASGDGIGIRLTDIQLAGKKRMMVAELLRGNPDLVQVGQLLE